MGAVEIIGMVAAGLIILLFIVGMAGFLASLLYFHNKWEEQERRDEEELKRYENK